MKLGFVERELALLYWVSESVVRKIRDIEPRSWREVQRSLNKCHLRNR